MENIFENRANKNKIEKLCPGIYEAREVDVNDYITYCEECNPTAKNYQGDDGYDLFMIKDITDKNSRI